MTIPILLGVVVLIGLLETLVDSQILMSLFTGNVIIDSILGALIGAISAGNPITSYIFGGKMLELVVGMMTIVAFIVAWVTVGVVQLPAEIAMLGKKFALLRNLLSFISAVFIGIFTYLILLLW